MGFMKKAMLLSGVPVRPSTKRERSQKANIRAARTLQRQTKLMEQQARQQAAPHPTIPTGPPIQSLSIADELHKLGQLVHDGVISGAEFEAAKAQLLGGAGPAQPALRAREGWWPDPSKRFDRRYFNGQRWTEHVINDADQLQLVDPLR
jgi:hypothetical protein